MQLTPKIKTKRKDILRNQEVDLMLLRADAGVTKYGKQTFRFNPVMVKALIAMLWIWGKRITEVLKVKREDMFLRKHGTVHYLYVRFTVLKKKGLREKAVPQKVSKRISTKNPYAIYILKWLKEVYATKEQYVFPGRVRERTFTVRDKKRDKVYEYHQEAEARMSRSLAYKILKGLNPDCWIHLFRHSVATEMAERGATEEELMSWFDWSRYDTAHEYVKGGPKLTAKWSKRTW